MTRRVICHDKITPGMSRKSGFGTQNGHFWLSEASRGLQRQYHVRQSQNNFAQGTHWHMWFQWQGPNIAVGLENSNFQPLKSPKMTIFGFLRPLEAKSCKATIEQLCSGNPLAYVLSMVGAQYSCWARKFKFLAVKITQHGHFCLFEAPRGLYRPDHVRQPQNNFVQGTFSNM